MSPAHPTRQTIPPADRWSARLGWVAFLAGIMTAVFLARQLPPAPAFSPYIGRASYWQSYETAYFASLQAYEKPIRDLLADGNIPVVVFGDSTIRGTGALGENIWTRQLEKRLQAVNPRVQVLNYAQNAGDLMGPFLYHYLQHKFPEARYIVQWHFSSEVGMRHQFHFWLTSEIALRDGYRNPAVRRSFNLVHVTRPDERAAFAMAGLNLLTHYLEVGNWVRYRWLGRPFFDWDRKVKIQPLAETADAETVVEKFKAPDEKQAANMRMYFLNHQAARSKYVQQGPSGHAAYFAEQFPAAQRSHLLLLTLDFSPYYAPHDDAVQLATWRSMWADLRREMAQFTDLNWVSLTGSAGELEVDDYLDLGHLTVSGQHKLAETVAAKLLAPGGWFDPAAPGAEQLPRQLKDQWYETKDLKNIERMAFVHMQPQPSRFFSSFGPGLDQTWYNAHPETRLQFQIPAGAHRLQTSLQFNPSAYRDVPAGENPTDGVQVEIALLGSDGQRTVVYQRLIDPVANDGDRGVLPLDVSFRLPHDAAVELYINAGPAGQNNRDWISIGKLLID
jgi:hypothetical protein